jgi:hypothetical protein
MSNALKEVHTHAWDFWLARASVALIAILQLLLINRLGLGPRWLAPALEIALLLPLSFATVRTQINARTATHDHHWLRIASNRLWIWRAALVLTALIMIVNTAALFNLVHALLAHVSNKTGQTLLLDAMNIWLTNVIVFALWYWNLDRGSPATRAFTRKSEQDFLFPQMIMARSEKSSTWSPGFLDYAYVSFTNAAAFSPTDTMPLSARAKILMMCESAISLATLALVAARAVNILT